MDYDLLDENYEEESVELEEVDLNEDLRKKSNAQIIYPCVEIEGITTEQEFDFFRRRCIGKEVATLPLYCFVEGIAVRIGDFCLDLDSLLAVREISDYEVYIAVSETEKKPIDLNDPETLIKFIRL